MVSKNYPFIMLLQSQNIIFLSVLWMENLHYFYILSSLTFLLTMQLSFAADTVTTATFICDGEKLVSSSQRFELGFSSPGNSKHRCLGIGFKKSPDTVVWLLKAQNLVAQLLDTRNFVLGDNILVVIPVVGTICGRALTAHQTLCYQASRWVGI